MSTGYGRRYAYRRGNYSGSKRRRPVGRTLYRKRVGGRRTMIRRQYRGNGGVYDASSMSFLTQGRALARIPATATEVKTNDMAVVIAPNYGGKLITQIAAAPIVVPAHQAAQNAYFAVANNSAAAVLLSGVQQGVSFSERIGRRIYILSVDVRMTINPLLIGGTIANTPAAGANNSNPINSQTFALQPVVSLAGGVTYRALVVMVKNPTPASDDAPNLGNVLKWATSPSGVLGAQNMYAGNQVVALQNPDYRDNYVILKDMLLRMDQVDKGALDVVCKIPVNKHVEYSNVTDAQAAISANQIWLVTFGFNDLLIQDSAGAGGLNYNAAVQVPCHIVARLNYTDV